MSVRLYRECKLGHLEDDVKPLAPAQFPDDEDDNDDDSVVYYVDDDDRSDEDEDEQMRQRGDYDELTPQEQALEDFRRHILASSGNCCGYEESYWAMKKMHPQWGYCEVNNSNEPAAPVETDFLDEDHVIAVS